MHYAIFLITSKAKSALHKTLQNEKKTRFMHESWLQQWELFKTARLKAIRKFQWTVMQSYKACITLRFSNYKLINTGKQFESESIALNYANKGSTRQEYMVGNAQPQSAYICEHWNALLMQKKIHKATAQSQTLAKNVYKQKCKSTRYRKKLGQR